MQIAQADRQRSGRPAAEAVSPPPAPRVAAPASPAEPPSAAGPGCATGPGCPPGASSVAERLHAFLNAYWLRPENALWMTLRSLALDGVPGAAEPPATDVSCGDGVFSFLHAGGRLADAFDVFEAAGRLGEVRDAHADMFDVPPAGYAPRVVRRPARRIAVGVDLKPNLLAKARALDFYERLVQHDNNTPLPFPTGAFTAVYCNSAYWIARIEPFLAELARVTRPGGRVVLHVKLADMARYTLGGLRPALGGRFVDLIGRGRLACWPTVASRAEWERRFGAAGLDIVEATAFVTRTHAHLWDVGLRPLAPLLVRMAQAIDGATRLAIKRDWVALFDELLAPMCRPDFELLAGRAEPAEMQYVLTPR